MQFNPDPSTQANEIIFTSKFKFNNNNINTNRSHQKHLGVVLDSNHNLTLIDQKTKKCNKMDRSYKTTFSKSYWQSFTYNIKIFHKTSF